MFEKHQNRVWLRPTYNHIGVYSMANMTFVIAKNRNNATRFMGLCKSRVAPSSFHDWFMVLNIYLYMNELIWNHNSFDSLLHFIIKNI